MTAFLLDLVTLSAKATLVVLVVLIAQYTLRRWLPAGFRHALWGLVGLRLMLPVLPESPVSVVQAVPGLALTSALPALGPWSETGSAGTAGGLDPWPTAVDIAVWVLGGVWILMAAALLARWAVAHWRIRGLLRRATPVRHPVAQRLLWDCRGVMGIDRHVRLLETGTANGPATYGSLRPAILVPADFFDRLREDQQKNVLLHELAHLKRHDSLWLQLAHVLVAVHWFNPFLWLALRRFQTDLEMACDATVLSHLKTAERSGYGKTLLEVGGRRSSDLACPCFAVKSKQQLKRRIHMITRFRSRSWRRSALLLPLAAVMILITLTDIPTSLARGSVADPAIEAERLAEEIVGILEDGDPSNAGRIAAHITESLEATRIPLDELDRALRAEALEHEGETARMLVAVADLWRVEKTKNQPLGVDEAQKRDWTVAQIRNVGTSMYRNIWWASASARRSGKIESQASFRWRDCPAISHERLQELLGPNFEVPRQDGWGGTLEFCLDQDFDRPHSLIGVRSPGSDGRFDDETYNVGSFDPSQPAHDIVWIDGYFARWPEARVVR